MTACRYRRGRWSPQHDDLDDLYENAETPYQWELENPASASAAGNDSINGSAPVVSRVVDGRVKENGGVSS